MTAFAIWAVGFPFAMDFNVYVRHIIGKVPYTPAEESVVVGTWLIVGLVLFIIGLLKN
jgi:hypothetical protein